jgi:acyl carrier protein
MSDQDDRLVRCFAGVFPTLSVEEIRTADVVPLFDLDSLAGVTLVTLIDQEFGVDVEMSDLLKLGSFQAIEQYLQKQNPSGVIHE